MRKIYTTIYNCEACGNSKEMLSSNAKRAKSCGCLKGNLKHGMKGTRQYRAWRNMKDRCTNKNNTYWHRYGGRGISISEDWMSFEGFWKDNLKDYRDDLTIDRIDNDGNYCKENCRWVTQAEQAKNKTNSINYNGESARQAGIRINGNPSLVYQRLNVGWDIKTAFEKKSKRQKLAMR